MEKQPKSHTVSLDRQSVAYQTHAEFMGFTGMPCSDRTFFEKPSQEPIIAPQNEAIGIPKVEVPEK